MELLSYLASLLATVSGICGPFWKKIEIVLLFNLFTNVSAGISYLLIGGYSGAAMAFIGGGQLIINHLFKTKLGKIPTYLIFIHIASFFVMNILTFTAWYDILMLTSSTIFVLGIVQTNSKHYRTINFFNCLLMVFYDILAKAYGNLFMHIILFSASILAIWVKDSKKKD